MRFFSARTVAPAAVDEAAIDAYMRYRAQTTALVAVGIGWFLGRMHRPF
jgi:hypothetical protein